MNLKRRSLPVLSLIISLILALGVTACHDSKDRDAENPLDIQGNKYDFLQLVDGKYKAIDCLVLRESEELDATVAYGYIDDDDEAVLYSGKYTIRPVYGDELTGRFSVKPSGKSTESCEVTADLDKDEESVYLFCELDDCPGIVCASLPIMISYGDMDMMGAKRDFLRKVNGKYQYCDALWIHNGEDLDADIAFGSIDDDGEVTLYASKFEVRNAWGDDPIDYVTVDPSGTSTENCKVTAQASGGEGMPYILCTPDDCPGILCASLPIGGFTGRGGVMHFLQKDDNGNYKPINYISAHEGITTLTIAYGDVDDNGKATLYDTKYWAKDNVEELNGFLTVIPTGTSTQEAIVVVNTEKDHNCNFLYCEPDNYPGVICASLPVIVTHGE